MRTTRIVRHLRAPRAAVYQAIIDAASVQRWMVPQGMRSEVHVFESRQGGAFRISLTYDAPDAKGKSSAHTDTYHGRFVELVPDEKVVQVMEFETEDPAMQGEMKATFTLRDDGEGTELVGVHEDLPRGVRLEDNDLGWRMAFAKLAELVERASAAPVGGD